MAVKQFQKTLDWEQYANKALNGEVLSLEEGLHILNANNKEILALMQAAYKVRYHYYRNKVKLNMIINAKSGLCPEDCGYCSQSITANTSVERYPLLEKDVLVNGAEEA